MDILQLIRKRYQEASTDLEELEDLWEAVKQFTKEEGVFYAYKAAAKALKAKASWIPHKKWNHIKEAMSMFQEAIDREPENIEMRFLRFTVQHNTPDFLELNSELEEDLDSILAHIHRFAEFKLENEHLLFMLKFLESSKRLSLESLEIIKEKIIQNPKL